MELGKISLVSVMNNYVIRTDDERSTVTKYMLSNGVATTDVPREGSTT